MPNDPRFQRLLEPGKIGSVKTRNRLIKTGAGTFMWHQDETHMNKAILSFYEAFARGGVGLLIVESPTIDYPKGARWPERYRIDDDKYIAGLSELVEIIHKYNCPTFMQMNHDGPWQRAILGGKPFYEGQPIAASPVTLESMDDFHNEVPHEMTIGEIENIIDKFASAAVRAQKAGFDGVDLNAGSSHLLHNFLSPFWNRRNDAYGGSRENRARFVTSIVREIKKRLGSGFPVSVCINSLEVGKIVNIPDDKFITVEDGKATARLLEKAGADAIHVRSHWLGRHVAGYLPDLMFYPEPPVPLSSFPKEYYSKRHGAGANLDLAAGIKKEVSIPIMVVGKLDAEMGEQALREGKADFIAMTRRLQADPELPNKVAAGRLEDIAPCTACENCLGTRRCRINVFMGKEFNTIEKAPKPKKVVVIGGGPAGMEAARVAALRGHDVTLFDKSAKLGGLLPIAAVVKGAEPEDIQSIVRYYQRQLDNLGVKVHLGKEAGLSSIDEIKPDAVIIAAGGVTTIPGIPGINASNVIQGADLHRQLKFFLRFVEPKTLRSLTRFYLPVGKRVVIIGSSLQGCELGEFLTKRGRKVTIVDTAPAPGTGMVDAILAYLLKWFQEKGVVMKNGIKEYVEITGKGLTIINSEGKKELIEADSIIPSLPLMPNLDLMKSLEGKVPEVYAVGDCKEPLLIADAINAGAMTSREI